MGGLSDLLPGVDLCLFAAGQAPDGQTSNLVNPYSLLKPLTISFCVILTEIALCFSLARLWSNIKKLTWSDAFVTVAILISVTQAVLMITFVRRFRHKWDFPLCWINAQFLQVAYAYEILTSMGLFFAKTATLLLFHQLFQVSKQMRLAIYIGITVNFLKYFTSAATMTWDSVPHVGQTWDDVVIDAAFHPPLFRLKWSVAQAAIGTVLDIYIFILPLPTISRLNLSRRRRIQLLLVFFTAILGIVASVVSLVYRVKLLWGTDSTWTAGILMNFNEAELNVAIIVASAPGFAGFMRQHVADSKLAMSLRSLFGSVTQLGNGPWKQSSRSRGHTNEPASVENRLKHYRVHDKDLRNQRSGEGGGNVGTPRQQSQKRGYYDLDETWLMHSRATVDIEHQADPPHPVHQGEGVRVQRSVEQAFQFPSEAYLP